MDLVIIGAGGHGKVVLDILRANAAVDPLAGHNVVGFLDADPALRGTTVAGVPVLGPVNLLPRLRAQGVTGGIVAIGDNATRARHGDLFLEHAFELVNAIHPSAVICGDVILGRSIVVAAHATVGVNSRIEDYAIVNTGAVVDHECHVGVAAHVTPGVRLAGRVRVGERAFIGLGANVIQCLTIGDDAVVGAGAVVLRDVPAGVTVVGVPARVVDRGVPRSPK